jgi:hypothetical protein
MRGRNNARKRAWVALLLASAGWGQTKLAEAGDPGPPPEWALWQRHLLREMGPAARDVILQAGLFGEHRFTTASFGGDRREVNSKLLAVRLRPGSTAVLELGLVLWANRPSYAFPW